MEASAIRILVVDDDLLARKSIERFLLHEGYSVDSTDNGNDALLRLQRKPADLILSDIKMPGMDGLELLSRTRREFPESDSIMISGHGTMEDVIEAMRRGACDYLRKPIELQELSLVLQRVLNHRELKRTTHILQSQLFEAQKMDALGRLAGGVAHEINNLMGGIVGYCDIARQKKSDESYQKAMNIGIESAQRASSIANNLLRFARRDRTGFQLSTPGDLVHDAIELLERKMKRFGITLSLDIQDTPTLMLNEGEYEQAIVNVLENAIQAIGAADAPDRQIRITLRATDKDCILEIADSGPGIPQEERERVLEPFYTRRGLLGGGMEPGATGLGLAVVHGIMKRHNGRIEIDTASEGGACIRLIIPLHSTHPRLSGNLLVFDRDRQIGRIYAQALRRSGFNVDVAESIDELHQYLEQTTYIGLILDREHPQLPSGDEMTDLFHQIGNVVLVILSGTAEPDDSGWAQIDDDAIILPRPVDPERLLQALHRHPRIQGDKECADE